MQKKHHPVRKILQILTWKYFHVYMILSSKHLVQVVGLSSCRRQSISKNVLVLYKKIIISSALTVATLSNKGSIFLCPPERQGKYVSSYHYTCVLIALHMSSYHYMCPHTTTCVSSHCQRVCCAFYLFIFGPRRHASCFRTWEPRDDLPAAFFFCNADDS